MMAWPSPSKVGSGAPFGRSRDSVTLSLAVVSNRTLPPGRSAVGVGYVSVGRSSTTVPPVPNVGSSPPELASATAALTPATSAHAPATPCLTPMRIARRRSAVSGLEHVGHGPADHHLAPDDADPLHLEVGEVVGDPLGGEL